MPPKFHLSISDHLQAIMIPERISSLNLISTAAQIENTTTWAENLRTRINMFLPKSLDRSISDAGHMLFSDAWLDSPDETVVPTSSTPNVVLPPSGKYGMFTTNYERFAAQELTKRLDVEGFPRKGFMMQAVAAGWHYKSPKQLQELGNKVGRDRIMVLHGTKDKMITVPHGRKLIEILNPGVGVIKEGRGHVFMLEDAKWYNDMVEAMIEKGEKLKERKA
jgi:pimeloyl-ACP methyl ester carboxylesterase